MTKFFAGKVGGKNEYDKKIALKAGQKSVAQFCQPVKVNRLCCAKGVLDSLPKQCCTVNKGGKAASFRNCIFRGN